MQFSKKSAYLSARLKELAVCILKLVVGVCHLAHKDGQDDMFVKGKDGNTCQRKGPDKEFLGRQQFVADFALIIKNLYYCLNFRKPAVE